MVRQLLARTAALSLLLGLLMVPGSSVLAATKTATTTSTSAAPKTQSINQSVTQSYTADNTVQQGMLVKLKDKQANTIEPMTASDEDQLLGVTIAATDSTVTITPTTASGQQVFVATSGRYNVLVSNQNGVIKTGDYIAVSAIAGVGMKASSDQTLIIGKAAANFNGTSNIISTVKLTDQTGKSTNVTVSRIPVDLNIAHNPLNSSSSDYVPGFLAKASQLVSGKPVSAARIYLGLATLIVSAFITGTVVFSGVRSGMIAIGRNPLSKKSIIKSLIQTVIAGLIIFIVGVVAVYLLLKL